MTTHLRFLAKVAWPHPGPIVLLGLFLVWLLLASCTPTQDLSIPPPPAAPGSLPERVDSLVLRKLQDYALPGLAIGVVRNGAVVYTQGYGVRSLATGAPVTARSVFHTASVSKLFTAQAAMDLVRDGRLTLDADLRTLAPELTFADARAGTITVRQLLNHTAGLPDIDNYRWARQHRDPASLGNYVRGLRLTTEFAPGTDFSYSNLGYDLLGYLVERAAGVPFEDYVRTAILQPSGMAASDFRYFRIADSLRTAPHTRHRITGQPRQRSVYPYTREHAPSSTLNASATDLARWLIDFQQQTATRADYRLMLEPSTEHHPGIGLGFQLGELAGYRTAGHYGGDRGFRSYLLLIPDRQIGVVVLGNADYAEDFRQEIGQTVARWLLAGR